MTLDKLTGVYFSETVGDVDKRYSKENIPLFIVQTSTSITGVDDTLVKFTSFADFRDLATGKGLTKTLVFMNKVLADYECKEFYVYNVKTDSADAFKNLLIDASGYKEIIDVLYFEETARALSGKTVHDTIESIKTALEGNNFERGALRTAIIVPYATVHNAVTNKGEGVTNEEAVITALTSAFSGVNSGRIIGIVPDLGYYSATAGKIVSTAYNREPGYPPCNINLADLEYSFTEDQMITLQNLGLVFCREEKVQGVKQYRINLGVTTSFAANKADGLIKARKTTDELLRQCGWACEGYVKQEELESGVSFLQNEVDTVIDAFVEEESVQRNKAKGRVTQLTVIESEGDAGLIYYLEGDVYPTKCIEGIHIRSTLN